MIAAALMEGVRQGLAEAEAETRRRTITFPGLPESLAMDVVRSQFRREERMRELSRQVVLDRYTNRRVAALAKRFNWETDK
ncbi:hypothetical protein Axy23_020 [Achromobacter phage vB_AxyP_19-32_Axy23]|uniref:Uncharacterized protein n=1 Tax=Achromobacter phage vB_AxyP_19-32_Axy23 TaxID=2591047 RepID=A0A514CW50_9CAUD|nr:hypothetical protein Axy23_020 [Achromobacter phage vB_AxyP_19-32_Axy23]